ncbi:uncharacterized protein LOC124872897 isoform X4 [Girardinichthys multiradiatus]|nr:uncharacterized protein LOC124872897 isoform X4 [Girardinichthys multiradiatus]
MSKRKARKKPADEATFYIQSSKDKPGLMERFIDDHKGRGVFATQPIEQGDFVLEYRGQLLSADKCQTRKYSEKESTFLFEFEWQNRHWCIDASIEDGSLGRLVNDNHKSPNCNMKKIIVNDQPHLCLFAIKKIEIGTEIDYNYGDSKWPWREKAPTAVAEPARTSWDSFPDDSITQDASLQLSIIKGVSLVDYSDSDDDSQKDVSAPLQKQIKRTTIMMNKVPSFSDAIYNSSNDCMEGPSTSFAMDSQRPIRGTYFSKLLTWMVLHKRKLICLTELRMAPIYPHKKKIQKLLKRHLVSPHPVA